MRWSIRNCRNLLPTKSLFPLAIGSSYFAKSVFANLQIHICTLRYAVKVAAFLICTGKPEENSA
jgi:hypothetical protein